MKIVYVTVSFPFGTVESFLIPELEELIAQGHQVLIIPVRPGRQLTHGGAAQFVARAKRSHLLSPAILHNTAVEFCRSLRAVARIIRLFAKSRSLKIMAKNTAVIPKGLWLSKIARDWGADHIHAYWASTVASVALVAGECAGIPWSFTGHRHDIQQNNLLTEKTRHAAFVRVISESGLRMSRLAEAGLASKAFVLHLGVSIPPLSESRERSGRLIALCPANLVPVKGHRYLIDAIAMLRDSGRDIELWLAGNGELRGQLEQRVRKLHLQEQVRFFGQLPRETVLSLYENGDVDMVVLPSIDLGNGHHEGIPVALMEAMAYAIPVIATDTGGIPELVGSGTGLLVEPANPQALAGALTKFAGSSELRKSLGLEARKRVEQSFEITKNVKELVRRFGKSLPGYKPGKRAQHQRSTESFHTRISAQINPF